MPASKQDLLIVLKSINPKDSTKLTELADAEHAAAAALKEFEQSNAEYLRLNRAANKARSAHWRFKNRSSDTFNREIRECRNAVYLHGATPAVVKMIERLLKKHSKN